MRWLDKLVLRLRSLLRKGALDRDLDEELRYHIERQVEENVAAGMSPAAARAAAMRDFGGVEAFKEECRDERRVTLLHDLAQDARYGARMIARSPGFTAVAVLTLALGIGANTAIFSFLDTVLLRTLPVRDPGELVVMTWQARREPDVRMMQTHGDCSGFETGATSRDPAEKSVSAGCSFSLPFFDALRGERGLYAGVAAFAPTPPLLLAGNGAPTEARGQLVSGDYFATLGVAPALGRLLDAGDDAHATPVAVLSHRYWQQAFGGDPSVLGRTLSLNGVPVTVVGVADARFTRLTPGNVHDLWLPLSLHARLSRDWDKRNDEDSSWWLTIIARLRPDVPQAQAQAATSLLYQAQVLAGGARVLDAADQPAVALLGAVRGLTGTRGQYALLLGVMMIAVGIVLLVACANVAGLLLARATARRREIAVRLAMGASRGRIIRQLLTESVMLAVLGGALGALLALWGVQAMMALVAENPSLRFGFDVAVDGRVLAVTSAVSVLVGIVFGLAPAFQGTRIDLAPALKDATGGTSRGRRLGLGGALVAAQVALAIPVLVGAGLLVRTVTNLYGVDAGFRADNVLLFDLDPTRTGLDPAKTDALNDELRRELATIPGVTSASFSQMRLLSGGLWRTTLRLTGGRASAAMDSDVMGVGPGFFDTMGIALRDGRTLTAADVAQQRARAGATPALVNEAFRRRYFPDQSPLGERLEYKGDEPGPTFEIVGVVGDTKYNDLRRELEPAIYLPASGAGVTFEVRTAADPAVIVPGVRAAVARLAPQLPIVELRTQAEEVDQLLFKERLLARLLSLFGFLALGLACIGLYALLSYDVTRSRRELGIRLALGAQRRVLRRAVVARGLRLALAGAVVGIAAALAVTRFLASQLFGVAPTDPLILVSVPAALVLVAVAASYIPARRATLVDPMEALRAE